jgi:hypothetical protein
MLAPVDLVGYLLYPWFELNLAANYAVIKFNYNKAASRNLFVRAQGG